METLLVAVTALGVTGLFLGLIGLASGRLDRRVIRTRARAGCLAALGLSLLFLGAAPPTRAAPGAAGLPDTRPPVPIRAALQAAEQNAPAVPQAQTVFPEQERHSGSGKTRCWPRTRKPSGPCARCRPCWTD